MISIIIPAYNEEAVIGRTLTALLAQADRSQLEVIVCCNGCTDRTAEIARSFGPPVQVLETPTGSKTVALNMGDAAAQHFPRIYLDADIQLDFAAIQEIARALNQEGALAVAPRMRVQLTGRNWLIRAFYEVWLRTPYHLHGMIGSGIYALSKDGRSRFDQFPAIIADDDFVRAHFRPEERLILDSCSFVVTPPATLSSLIRIMTRASLGNKELRQKHPELIRELKVSERAAGHAQDFWRLLAQPSLWPKLPVYAFVKIVAKWRAAKQLGRLQSYRWERDETARA